MKKSIATLVLSLTLSIPTIGWGLDLRLPDMGNAVDRTLSPEEEVALGEAFFARLRQQADFIDDPLVLSYTRDLGQRLAAATGFTTFEFQFEVINDPTINAFVVPGGFVGINSGLFLLAENESELAGVIAHEIAHGIQRHTARMFAGQGMNNLTALAGIVGAVLLSSVSPDAATAAATAGVASAAQSQINFTRAHEYEADRIAIQILQKTGIDPRGMVSFFEKMQRREVAGSPMNQLSYLRTHPLTSERIAEAQARVENLPKTFSGSVNSLEFNLAQARISVLTQRAPTQPLPEIAAQYREALLKLKARQYEAAQKALESLAERHPGLLWFELPLAQSIHDAGDYHKADQKLASLEKLYPDNSQIILQRAQWAIEAGDPQKALNLTSRALRSRSDDPLLYLAQSRAAKAAGNMLLHYESLGRYFMQKRRLVAAHQEFRKAYPYSANDPIAQQRIEASLTHIERILKPDEE